MAKTLQFRRGSTATLSSITGAVGELFVDTSKDTVVVMDGSTAGGFPLARESALSDLTPTYRTITINGNTQSLSSNVSFTVSGGGDYSNVQVATYLPTYSGNIANITLGPSGVLTFADGTTQVTAGGGSYSNVQVATYLPTYSGNVANLTLNSSATIFAGNATANITIGDTTWGPDPQNQKITIGGVGQKIYFNGNSSQYSYMDDDEFYIYDGKNNATAYYKANQFALNRNDYTGYLDAGPGTITIGAYVGNDRSFVANLNMVTWGNATVRTTINASGVTTSGNIAAANLLITDKTIGIRVGNLRLVDTSGTIRVQVSTGPFNIETPIGANINLSTSGAFTLMPAARVTGGTASTDTTSGALVVTGGVGISGNINAGNTQIYSLGVGTAASATMGEIRATNEVTAYYSSDVRLKENIQPIENALGKLKQLRGVMFDWIDEIVEQRGGEDDYFVRKHDTGVIAQEVEAVLPEVVAERTDGYKAVRYEKLAGLIIQAINELADEVEHIKSKIE
jgi:hypothetical protein